MIPDILLSVLFFVPILTNVAGNVCLVVYRTKQMRRPMNYLLVNFAVADIIIGVFMLPRFVFHHAFQHPTGWCTIAVRAELDGTTSSHTTTQQRIFCVNQSYTHLA